MKQLFRNKPRCTPELEKQVDPAWADESGVETVQSIRSADYDLAIDGFHSIENVQHARERDGRVAAGPVAIVVPVSVSTFAAVPFTIAASVAIAVEVP